MSFRPFQPFFVGDLLDIVLNLYNDNSYIEA